MSIIRFVVDVDEINEVEKALSAALAAVESLTDDPGGGGGSQPVPGALTLLRRSAGLGRHEVAELVGGLTESVYSALERAQRPPSFAEAKALVAIARALALRLDPDGVVVEAEVLPAEEETLPDPEMVAEAEAEQADPVTDGEPF